MSICRLTDCATALEQVDSNLSAWLKTVVNRLKHGLPAVQALELAGPGARRERDKFLIQAALVLRRDESMWSLSGRLSARINSPKRRHPDLVDELLELAAASAPIPTTQRRIYSILLSMTEIEDIAISDRSGE